MKTPAEILDETILELIIDLKTAENILSDYTGGYSGSFLSAEEFHKELKDKISKLEDGDKSVIEDFLAWFAPTSAWDDFTGDADPGEEIFKKLTEIKNLI